MAASLTIEQATLPQPPLPTPSLASEDGEDIDSDHRPILERENDDDGPPPIQSPRYRNRLSLLLPPAPPTSRGTSFDEPMCTQNARSQADLWLVGFWLEQRMDSEDAPIDTTIAHNPPYRDPMLVPELYWDDSYDSRATLIQSYQSSDYSDQEDDSLDILPSERRSSSYTESSFTYQSTEYIRMTPLLSDSVTETRRRVKEHKLPAKEGHSTRESGHPFDSDLSGTAGNPGTKGGRACHVECSSVSGRIDICYHSSKSFAPPQGHPIRGHSWAAACESNSGGRGPNLQSTTEFEPIAPTCSVWEDDEREGRWPRLAALFHPSNKRGRTTRKGRYRTRVSKLFKHLSCCSAGDEL